MDRDNGLSTSAIWLLGDSPPKPKYADLLDEPLDWRFPTRHNIWTPIETVINRVLFREKRSRIDDSKFYVRNAVESPDIWEPEHKLELDEEVLIFRKIIEKHPPFLILTFGQRAFEFARQARNETKNRCNSWTVPKLSKAFDDRFDDRLSDVRKDEMILLPLLHASIARRFWWECHRDFSGNQENYYENVGGKLATIFKEHRDDPRLSELWM